ncbi:hypothetical protein [Streptomyces sp. DSM 41013]
MNQPEDSAAARLRHLNEYLLEHPVTGPSEGRNPTRTASAPMSLGTLDHMRASVAEVVAYTREANPQATPLPESATDIYRWCVENTYNAPEAVQQRRDVIEYRQYLEHAIRAGDWRKVIRPQRCPECRCFGLMWQAGMQRALCTNTECVDRDGMSTTVTLARLAHEHIAGRKKLRQVRTT